MTMPDSMNIVTGRWIARRGMLIGCSPGCRGPAAAVGGAAPASASFAGGRNDAVAVLERARPGRDDARAVVQARTDFDAIRVADAGFHGDELRRHGLAAPAAARGWTGLA
jgi:hypothetical protein